MAVNGISGMNITGTLGSGAGAFQNTRVESERNSFEQLVKEIQSKNETENKTVSNVASSQIARNHRLNGDYKQGFYGVFTSESDKTAKPSGFAANSVSSKGKSIVIDKTSELYAQSMEMENYMMKMMLSSMRNTIQRSNLFGDENDYARDMYEDMMYDNISESLTKNAGMGIADQIYIELSGQR